MLSWRELPTDFEYEEQIKTKIAMDIRTEIHSNVSKQEAYELMEKGHKICHEYYSDDEYLRMKDGVIYDENGYRMGTKYDEFWSKIQKWETGWMTTNAR